MSTQGCPCYLLSKNTYLFALERTEKTVLIFKNKACAFSGLWKIVDLNRTNYYIKSLVDHVSCGL